MNYRAPLADMQFITEQVLGARQALHMAEPSGPRAHSFAEASRDVVQEIWQQAAQFAERTLAPLNALGDAEGAQWQDGRVTTPAGFRAAYQQFWQAGWPSLCADAEDGGQELPSYIDCALYEMLIACNHAWTMAPALLHGAYACLKTHGSAWVQQTYCAQLASGAWLATMCLTESQAGSDLGACRTRAQRHSPGEAADAAQFALYGTKIFISGGEHDLSDNIVHLVLAREEGAPAGAKGLSLFVLSKILADGTRSRVRCSRIEHKMGLHASPTCEMQFDGALAHRVGQPGQGLAAMFVMMNAARLHVAVQGLGLLEAAWQRAQYYARQRVQLPPASDPKASILQHPAIARKLDTQRAWLDGLRVLIYHTAVQLDIAHYSSHETLRDAAQCWCSLVTPILKAVATEQAFVGASACLQVFGGHGYVRDYGIEQIVRDARIALIYEGTNEIQALDLLQRKVCKDKGAAMGQLLQRLQADFAAAGAAHQEIGARVHALASLTQSIVQRSEQNSTLPSILAEDYLRACGLVLLDWAWLRILRAKPEIHLADAQRWQAAYAALNAWILPEFAMRLTILQRACPAA